jgi:hypothetical protein
MMPDHSTFPRPLRWRVFAIAIVSCLAIGASIAALGQDSSLRAERVLTFTTGKSSPLAVKIGPVNIQSVEFSDRGRAGGGFGGALRGAIASEMSTTIRGHFLAENPTADDWQVTFTLEFLDKSGKIIDRVTRKEKWDGEAKAFDLDHPILQYVVPLIAQVRIKLEGKTD